jgi:hypothetical protein
MCEPGGMQAAENSQQPARLARPQHTAVAQQEDHNLCLKTVLGNSFGTSKAAGTMRELKADRTHVRCCCLVHTLRWCWDAG